MTQAGSYVRDNIVKLVDSKSKFYGTGFLVKDDFCATCHHCICEIEDGIYIEGRGERYAAEWLEDYSNMSRDIAILRLKNSDFKPLECAKEALPKLPVSIWGFSAKDLENFPKGAQVESKLYDTDIPIRWKEIHLSGSGKWNQKPQVDVNVYKLEGKIDLGFSGAPVCYGFNNRVVGMFTAKDDDYGYVIPIETVLEKFEKSIAVSSTQAPPRHLTKTKEELQIYYGVETARLIKIRDSKLDELKYWIKDWFESSRKNKKPILLVTGKPGTGKSWLAYRLATELMNELYSISIIKKGFDIHKHLLVEGNTQDSSIAPVFILDDQGIAVGVVGTSIDANDVYDIIKNILPTNPPQSLAGPMIFSMREENWNYIVNGPKNRDRFDELQLQELVEIVILPPLEDEESEKLVESYYKVVDGKDPAYPQLLVTDDVKKKIAEASGGIPIVVNLFFDQKGSRVTHQETEVTEADVKEINSNSKYFALQQIFNYYLNSIMDKKTEVSITLAFLYFIINEGFVSVGHVKYLREKMENILPNELKKHIYLLSNKTSLPLFTTDNYGIVRPYHDSISEAVIGLVEKIDEFKETVFKQTDIIPKINRLRDIYSFINVKREAENEFIFPYLTSLTASMDHHFENYLENFDIEGRKTKTISYYTAYNFLSIFSEFLHRTQPYRYLIDGPLRWDLERLAADLRWEIGTSGFSIRSDATMQEVEQMNIRLVNGPLKWDIDRLAYDLRWEIGTSGFSIRSDATMQEVEQMNKLFDTLNTDLSDLGWDAYLSDSGLDILFDIFGLINKGYQSGYYLTYREIAEKTNKFMQNQEKYLQNMQIIRYSENKYFKRFFKVFENSRIDYEGMKDSMDEQVYFVLKNLNLFQIPSVGFKQYYLDLLSSKIESIKAEVWEHVSSFVDQNVITQEEIRGLRGNFLDMLKSKDESIRLGGWYPLVPILIDKGIIMLEEGRQLRENFFALLNSSVLSIRQEAWRQLRDFIERRLIASSDNKIFSDILSDLEKEIRTYGWKNLLILITNEILTLKEVRQLRENLFELLRTPPFKYDYSLFEVLNELVDEEVVDRREALVYFQKAAEEDPHSFGLWTLTGGVLYEMKKYEEAIKFYDKAIEINPNYSIALNNKALVLYEMKKYEEAIKFYDKAIEINPFSSKSFYGKGNSLYCLGKYDEAIIFYHKSIGVNPSSSDSWNAKANALYRLGRYDEAIECYDEVLKIVPNDTYAIEGKRIVVDKKYQLIKEKEKYMNRNTSY